MRIVFVNSNRRREGGVETYLHTIMPALKDAGHEVSLCHELDSLSDRLPISLPPEAPAWCVAQLGTKRAISAVRQWRPDVIYTHNVTSIDLERELLKIAPAVFYAHDYRGTCISGNKAFKLPVARPCSRRFGWQCLFHFYPRRCGGLNPATMLTLYGQQAKRLKSLPNYRTVITNSDHMRAEYIRQGVPADRVISLPCGVAPLRSADSEDSSKPLKRIVESNRTWRLAFAGRMDDLKGGLLLLRALPLLRSAAGRALEAVFAGDGPQRKKWESAAAELSRSTGDIRIKFPGWLADPELGALFRSSDLLVVPSVWPEPFGIVGVQAALQGVPAAAFSVGGIPTWLLDGMSGHLAPGDPPTAEGLADAIMKCLSDDEHYMNLCRGATEVARRFTVKAHVAGLIRILTAATRET
jgi:glycosyltransferase involved in cell wall biosynthesis